MPERLSKKVLHLYLSLSLYRGFRFILMSICLSLCSLPNPILVCLFMLLWNFFVSLLRVLVTVHASLPYHRLYFSTLSNDFSFFSISSLIGYHISINLLSLISLSASPTGNVISINVFFFPPLSLSFSDKMRTFSPSHSLTHSLSLSLHIIFLTLTLH